MKCLLKKINTSISFSIVNLLCHKSMPTFVFLFTEKYDKCSYKKNIKNFGEIFTLKIFWTHVKKFDSQWNILDPQRHKPTQPKRFSTLRYYLYILCTRIQVLNSICVNFFMSMWQLIFFLTQIGCHESIQCIKLNLYINF